MSLFLPYAQFFLLSPFDISTRQLFAAQKLIETQEQFFAYAQQRIREVCGFTEDLAQEPFNYEKVTELAADSARATARLGDTVTKITLDLAQTPYNFFTGGKRISEANQRELSDSMGAAFRAAANYSVGIHDEIQTFAKSCGVKIEHQIGVIEDACDWADVQIGFLDQNAAWISKWADRMTGAYKPQPAG